MSIDIIKNIKHSVTKKLFIDIYHEQSINYWCFSMINSIISKHHSDYDVKKLNQIHIDLINRSQRHQMNERTNDSRDAKKQSSMIKNVHWIADMTAIDNQYCSSIFEKRSCISFEWKWFEWRIEWKYRCDLWWTNHTRISRNRYNLCSKNYESFECDRKQTKKILRCQSNITCGIGFERWVRNDRIQTSKQKFI